ncbi:MAG TPA: dihydropteroate synthase [Actinomycetota bacterium]|nr:dihydropteroate synthase [Actinomycetota bacterium]
MAAFDWPVRDRVLRCGERTHVMGVINVTPDSFSDGGRFFDPEAAVAEGLRMADEGADLLDVGGESTRPGSDPVAVDDEQSRVLPVIKRLAAEVDIPISIDTRKHEVAAAALDAGATIVNDITAGGDPDMFGVVRDGGAGLVLMHIKGEPKTMQQNPTYEDVVREVHDHLAKRVEAAVAAGIGRDRLAVDPGLGFGKTGTHSLMLMAEIKAFLDLERPVVVGPSRKSFIGAALGDLPVGERLEGTAAAVAVMAWQGAHIVRVHDVREMARVVRVVDAIRSA